MDDSLAKQIEEFKRRIEELSKENSDLRSNLNEQSGAKSGSKQSDSGLEPTALNDADVTLKRLIQRIAMILQAEKVVIMFHDREKGELIGIPPAYNVDEEHLKQFRVRATQGISGEVFRSGDPIIYDDPVNDERTKDDHFVLLGVSNGICVPLIIEKRDEENRVIERTVIGVLHAFNKRAGEDFNEEDVHLLERIAKNVGAVIANLQLYREVVEEREELLQTFESLSAGLILVAADGRISQMNSTCRTIFAADQSAIGKPFNEVLNVPKLESLFAPSTSNADLPLVEIDLAVAKVDRIYQVQAARVMNEEGKDLGVVAIFSDVTDIKNIERMKSSFVAMASHELRTPLTAIKGFSKTLLDGLDEDMFTKEEQSEFLGIVVHECDRLRRLIDDLLNTSRIEAGESLKPNYGIVEFHDLLRKVMMVQQQSTTKHIIKLDLDPSTPERLTGDQDKLDQILTNLLNNAIKYAPGGGDITIHSKLDDKGVLVGIEDQGMGIPADHLAKVFERFHRVDNEDNRKIYGTGLGLFLVKHLVEAVHLGKLWCESEVGKGSIFWFWIPLELDTEEASRQSEHKP